MCYRIHLIPLFVLISLFCGKVLAASIQEEIREDKPQFHWSFEQDTELPYIGHIQSISGPDPKIYPVFPAGNRALYLDGKGAHVVIETLDAEKELQFRQGETLTIETWVRCDGIGNNQNQYIIGKGRTYPQGKAVENQNWALRLREQDNEAKISFLFRSEGEGEYHRWTSRRGFAPGSGWHHIAVVYTFGKPGSIGGFIDGVPTQGTWDLGGATEQPPVVDDGRVWIGSSRGGDPGNSFQGALDELAIYRHSLSPVRIQSRYGYNMVPPAPDLSGVGNKEVLVEVVEGVGSHTQWPREWGKTSQRFAIPSFALFGLPQKYGAHGERLDRAVPFLVRMSARIELSPGNHPFLLRHAGIARVWVDGQRIFKAEGVDMSRDAHSPMRPAPDPDLPYPRARLGTHDSKFSIQSEGGLHLLVMETVVGFARGSAPVYELLLAGKEYSSGAWHLVHPAEADSTPFQSAALHDFRRRQQQAFRDMATKTRRTAYESTAEVWNQRHREAKEYLTTLSAVEIPEVKGNFEAANEVDRFLARKILDARERSDAPDGENRFSEGVWPILEDKCIRCHGEKRKGGVRLDSRTHALTSGESGSQPIVPGDPSASEVFQRITAEDELDRMPPKGEALSREEIDIIGRWISEGARWSPPRGSVSVPEPLNELAFLRRLYLDTVGVPPTVDECRAYLADASPGRKERWVDRLLHDPRNADHWVSYWQDVLAENPSILKPTLNNTGPFRFWIYESLLDNKPFDRFVTELLTFQGSTYNGGAGGFQVATQNDAPMAAKAHVIGTGFLGVEMKCARCHDAPYHRSTQKDLFSIAGLLKGEPVKVPETSTVPNSFFHNKDQGDSLIRVSLDPGAPVRPHWPFEEFAVLKPSQQERFKNTRERLAWLITRPENQRFAQVIVNRVWARYFGEGIVEPVHDWEGTVPSHPELLDYLARWFVWHGYDVKALSKKILTSAAYARKARLEPSSRPEERYFEAPLRRRFTAEQLVDSLFHTAGVPLFSEELTLDVEGFWNSKDFLNFGFPRRAWQFSSPSTERDRPSLVLPHVNSVIAIMESYGWRPSRAEPVTERNNTANVLQSGMLANGTLAVWLTRLSPYSELTKMAFEARSLDHLIDDMYLRFLTRYPASEERALLRQFLASGFDSRKTQNEPFEVKPWIPNVREVSWSNHLSPEANLYAARVESRVEEGPEPAICLDAHWRERMEDSLWALINTPEFQFIP